MIQRKTELGGQKSTWNTFEMMRTTMILCIVHDNMKKLRSEQGNSVLKETVPSHLTTQT